MIKPRIRKKGKMKRLVEEELEDLELSTEDKIKELEEELLLEKEVSELKKKEVHELSKRIQEDIEFLESCVKPKKREKIKIMRVRVERGYNKFSFLYPVVERNGETKLVDIAYLVEKLLKTVDGNFDLLKQSVVSELLRKSIFKNVGLKNENSTRYFLEECLECSNSKDSLALYFGYRLLLPHKIEKVEETEEFDEKNRKIFNVYTLDWRGIDSKIYGVGISILKYLKIKGKINPCYDVH